MFPASFPILQTPRLTLIQIQAGHAEDVLTLFGDERVTQYYNLEPFKQLSEAQALVARWHKRFTDKAGLRWGISLKGEQRIIGTMGYNRFTPQHRANIGYDLQAAHWGKGYISEALPALLHWGFNTLGVNRIEAEVMPGNAGSEKVLTKSGFTREGLLRQWMFWNDRYYDMWIYALLKEEFVKNTAAP